MKLANLCLAVLLLAGCARPKPVTATANGSELRSVVLDQAIAQLKRINDRLVVLSKVLAADRRLQQATEDSFLYMAACQRQTPEGFQENHCEARAPKVIKEYEFAADADIKAHREFDKLP